MKKKYINITIITILLFEIITNINIALAGTEIDKFPSPLGATNIPVMLGGIVTAVLGIVGSLALLMLVYGGLTWMTAAGNTEQTTKARNIIVWSILGLVVIFFSYAIVRFMFQIIGI